MKEMNHLAYCSVCVREGRILCIRKTRGPYRPGDLVARRAWKGEKSGKNIATRNVRGDWISKNCLPFTKYDSRCICDYSEVLARLVMSSYLIPSILKKKNSQTVGDFMASKENDSEGMWVSLEK